MDSEDIDISEWFVFGELGLDGQVKENKYLYPLLLSLANQNAVKKAIVPKESLEKLTKIANVEFYGVAHINDALEILKDSENKILPSSSTALEHDYISVNEDKLYYFKKYKYDFRDVKGQTIAKRAALIAAVGFHNILLEGSPGCGKSMIAQRLRYILPPLSSSSILDIAKLQALEGCEPDFIPLRPFRSPHHTSTTSSIFGGGCHLSQLMRLYHNKCD